MKNIRGMGRIGRILLVLGSLMYVVELLWYESAAYTYAIAAVYGVSVILMLVEWFATRDERRAQKEAKKKQKSAA